jgi:two-component system NtrC family response regulator
MDNTNILIVDDDKSILRVFERVLNRRGGYRTDTAETGREAMEKLGRNSYQVALIDVRLPDIDGLDLLTRIHAEDPDMVKIILTGYASLDGGMKALSLGAAAYLVKPVKPQELLRVLESKLAAQKTLPKSRSE